MKYERFSLSVHFAMMALVVILMLLIVRFEPHTFLWGGVYGVMLAVGLDHFSDAVREMIREMRSW